LAISSVEPPATVTTPDPQHRFVLPQWLARLKTAHGLFLLIVLIMCLVVLVPFYFVVKTSFTSDATGALTLHNYSMVFRTSGLGRLLTNTIEFAGVSTIIAVAIGTFLAWVAEQTDTPGRWLIYLTCYASLAVPTLTVIIGWILLAGPHGALLNSVLQTIFGLKAPPLTLFSMTGLIFVHVVASVPLVFLLMVGPMRSMDGSMQEAALTAGASQTEAFFKVTLRLLKPAMIGVTLLMLVTGIEAFESPALIGTPAGITVLTTEIYNLAQTSLVPQYGLASAYSMMLLILVAIGVYFYARQTRQERRFVTITGKAMRTRRVSLGRWRWATVAVIVLIALVFLAPVLMLVWASILPSYGLPSMNLIHHLTFSNYSGIFSNSGLFGAFKNSAIIGVAAASFTVLIAAVTAWLVIRSRIRGVRILDYMATMPLIFPGIVLGLGVLTTYLTLPIPIYGTIWIIVVAYLARYIPYGMRFASAGMVQISPELEESAAMSGAGWWRSFRKVVLPLAAPSLSGAWIYIFLLSMKELTVALLVYSPGTQVNGVEIFVLYENGQVVQLAAFSVALTVVLAIIALGFRRISRRYGVQGIG
jgi:iron(III) transport system permease protein